MMLRNSLNIPEEIKIIVNDSLFIYYGDDSFGLILNFGQSTNFDFHGTIGGSSGFTGQVVARSVNGSNENSVGSFVDLTNIYLGAFEAILIIY